MQTAQEVPRFATQLHRTQIILRMSLEQTAAPVTDVLSTITPYSSSFSSFLY